MADPPTASPRRASRAQDQTLTRIPAYLLDTPVAQQPAGGSRLDSTERGKNRGPPADVVLPNVPLPTSWNSKDKCSLLQLTNGGMTVNYNGLCSKTTRQLIEQLTLFVFVQERAKMTATQRRFAPTTQCTRPAASTTLKSTLSQKDATATLVSDSPTPVSRPTGYRVGNRVPGATTATTATALLATGPESRMARHLPRVT